MSMRVREGEELPTTQVRERVELPTMQQRGGEDMKPKTKVREIEETLLM